MLDPLLQHVIAVSLALLFVAAARSKFRAGARFAAQLAAYELLPGWLTGPLARALPVAELLIGILLLLPDFRALAGIAAAGLLTLYGLAILTNVLRGRTDIDCGCGDAPQPVSGWLVARNLLLVAAALALTLPTLPLSFGVAEAAVVLLLSSLLAITYGLLEQLLRNRAALKHWGHEHG